MEASHKTHRPHMKVGKDDVTISSTISSTMENISIVDDDFDDGNDIVEAGHVNL